MMIPYYSHAGIVIYHGDCREVLPDLPDTSADSIVTDPPYGLGFMGKEWDGTGIAFHPEVWRECLRVLKPGGHILAFGGTRTSHRLACAVEDAGFEIRDSIAWLYGSGFPKSLDVSKAIDKQPGVERHAEFAAHLAERREAKGLTRQAVALAVVGTATGACWNWEHHQFPEAKWWPALRDLLDMDEATWGPIIAEAERIKTGEHSSGLATGSSGVGGSGAGGDRRDTAATDAAARWHGWGTALKPAFEPIIVGRKPLVGTVAANVLAYGTGAINVDGCRVATSDALGGGANKGMTAETRHEGYARPWMWDDAARDAAAARSRDNTDRAEVLGRWPANVALDCTQADALDRQSGTLHPPGSRSNRGDRSPFTSGTLSLASCADVIKDSGGVSRFFPTFRYEPKAPSSERPRDGAIAHPTVKPLNLIRWLARLVTPPGGTVLDPFAGSGTTAEACILEGCKCIAIEREADYLPLIVQRISKPLQVGLNFGATA